MKIAFLPFLVWVFLVFFFRKGHILHREHLALLSHTLLPSLKYRFLTNPLLLTQRTSVILDLQPLAVPFKDYIVNVTINLPHNKKQVGACPERGIYVIVFFPVGVVKRYRNCQQEQQAGWYFTIATWVMQERLSLNWGLQFQKTINFQAVVKALLTFLNRDFASQ